MYVSYTFCIFSESESKFLCLSLCQVTDKNDLQFLNSWHELNKPHVLLFDQVPVVPLLYKVGSLLVLIICEKYLRFS